jgi:hypothetical protein
MTEAIYAIETICGGDDAAGGGCGAPLNVDEVTKVEWEIKKGSAMRDFSEHNDNEVRRVLVTARDEGTLFVKCVYRPCSSCYKRF